MIDRKQLRQEYERVAQALARRDPALVAEDGLWQVARHLDAKQRQLKTAAEHVQAERNRISKLIGQKKSRGEDASAELAAMAEIARRAKELVRDASLAETEFLKMLLEIPNPPHPSVPDGMDEGDNVEIRRWGDPREDEVPPHWEIGEGLGILDFESAARISGSRFSVLKGMGARLERALIQFMLDMHVDEHGYEEVWTPVIVHGRTMTGTGQLPKFAHDLYKIEHEDAYLIPTAEVSVTNLYRDEILEADHLPIRHCAYTPCFRREAGSAGKDVRGLIRQHQFDKVELVHFVQPEDRLEQLERLTGCAEAVLQALQLPYRVVELCAGDLGFAAEKTYDLEVWFPAQKRYREISSCSSFGQFQGRRANIRVRDEAGRPEPLATLNGSGVAIGRCLAALLENGWREDGSVSLPSCLHRYTGARVIC
jgi:seryl-tRNA synthetase